MAVNKVDVNGSTVLDLTNDSVTPETLTKGATAHNAAGEQITGTYEAPVKSVNGKTGDVTLDYSDVNAQQKLYNLTLDTPIVENQTINPNSTYTFSSPITLNEYEIYWIDVQMVYEGKVQNRYQLLSRAVNGDSGITVQWIGYIVLDTTGVTLAISSYRSYIITIAKVLDYEIPVDSTIVYQEGSGCAASDTTAHAEGDTTTASGRCSHAEGNYTTASGDSSHAEGANTTASGDSSHAEGANTTASGYCSHAEGANTTASDFSHAEGQGTTASGSISHAEGYNTKASSPNQHVQGIYNIEDVSGTYAHIVGNGDSDTARSNAHTLDWSGNAWFAGTIEGKAIILPSSTEGSAKKFKITVDDSGAIIATEVT